MAKVFTTDMVAHVWAQNSQGHGRSGNGQLFFTGRALYSYGTHFMVGYIAAPGTVFLDSDGYSITTSKHKGKAGNATSYYCERFYVPKLGDLYDTLRAIVRHREEPRKGSALTALRKSVERAIAEKLDPDHHRDAGVWLLNQVGLPASRFDVIARKLNQAKAAKLATDTKEAVAIWRADARLFLEMSSSEFQGLLNATRYQESTYRADSDFGRLCDRLSRAHKQANLDKHNRRKAALWALLGRARAARKALAESGLETYVQHGRLARTVRAVTGLREFLASTKRGHIPPNAKQWDTARTHIECLLSGEHRAHMSPATRATLIALAKRLTAASDAITIESQRARYAAEQEAREAWLNGEGRNYGNNFKDARGGSLIRAVDPEFDGCRVIAGNLETSNGATVPLSHAVKVFAFVRAVRESGQPWKRNDGGRTVRVGHFQLDDVFASGDFVAGCHRINWGETERLARELGIWDCPADALESNDGAALASGAFDTEESE